MSLESSPHADMSQEEKEQQFLQFIIDNNGVTPQDLARFNDTTGTRFAPGDSAIQVIERHEAMGNIVPDYSVGKWKVAKNKG